MNVMSFLPLVTTYHSDGDGHGDDDDEYYKNNPNYILCGILVRMQFCAENPERDGGGYIANRVAGGAGVVLFTPFPSIPGESEIDFTCISWDLPLQHDVVTWIRYRAGQVDLTGTVLSPMNIMGHL